MGTINILFGIILLLLTMLGDYLLKRASELPDIIGWKTMLVGAFLYFISAIGWYYIYKTTKFIILGSFYSFGHIALTILIGIIVFKEKLSTTEIIGLLLGSVSLFLLLKNNNHA